MRGGGRVSSIFYFRASLRKSRRHFVLIRSVPIDGKEPVNLREDHPRVDIKRGVELNPLTDSAEDVHRHQHVVQEQQGEVGQSVQFKDMEGL